MNKFKRGSKLNLGIKVLIFFLSILFTLYLIAIGMVLLMHQGSKREAYCLEQAKKIAGNNWDKPVTETPEEQKNFGRGEIYWGIRLQEQCEQQQSLFRLYP